MQARPLEAVLALFVFGAAGLSLHEAGMTGIHRARTEPEAAAIEALVSARVADRRERSYQHTSADGARDHAVERAFIALGDTYLRSGRVPEAIAVFEMTIQAVPRSWLAWNGLGAAYESAGDRQRAVASYAQAVALNPANETGRRAIKRLQGI